jgi:NAD(P)-dependent dehydrogenase (short-subunit alcohol dehydrogenase family)
MLALTQASSGGTNAGVRLHRQNSIRPGGTSGINLGIAEAFAEAGAKLVIVSRSQNHVDEAQWRLRVYGGEVVSFSAAAFNAAHDLLDDIDILVSGAAGNFPSRALGMSANGFKAVVDIDLLGTFNVLRTAHAYLRKPGAVVVSISAPQALLPIPLQSHVCAAKAGVDMLTRVLAIEWGSDGIRVNSVMPGPIEDTEGMKRLAPTPDAMQTMVRGVPLGRMGTKQDVANLVLFLASRWAAFISGAVIPVDGGWSVNGASGLTSILRPQ